MLRKIWAVKLLILICAFGVFAQADQPQFAESQEVSETDGIPVIIKHLPDWENTLNRAILITKPEDLDKALGERPVFNLINFAGGTEAVTATYPQGKLLIVEYSTPQASADADNKIRQHLAEVASNPPIFYRRIGNYNVFLFDGSDESQANALFDQISYGKTVQWLDDRPFLIERAERALIRSWSDIFVSTVFAIIAGLASSIAAGVLVGFIFFRYREHQRAHMGKFSDAGGMTRLNLDDLTPDFPGDRLLNE